MTDLVLTADQLRELAHRIVLRLGTPEHEAGVVASSLVLANLLGHDSHGVMRLEEYAGCVRDGVIVPTATPRVRTAKGAVVAIDGQWAWGPVAAHFATSEAARLAREHGVGVATLEHCKHVGRVGEYSEALAAQGLGSIVFCNADPAVAPFGGRERALGTNPFAAGIPGTGEHPFILDFATAAAPEGKLRVARAAGKPVGPGVVVDVDGEPSTDPEAFYSGGALLPFGGHKGYGMSAFIELLAGSLSGNHPSLTERFSTGNGVVIIALDLAAFGAPDLERDLHEGADRLRGVAPTDPARPVLLPGDLEAAVRARREDGIPMTESIWESLQRLLRDLDDAARERRPTVVR